jgi:hypothetical protein
MITEMIITLTVIETYALGKKLCGNSMEPRWGLLISSFSIVTLAPSFTNNLLEYKLLLTEKVWTETKEFNMRSFTIKHSNNFVHIILSKA